LIHGVGLRAEAWGALMHLMSDDYTLYAIDMPGHGASPLGQVAALSDYTARVMLFLEALTGPICVVGHSMGAVIALEVASGRAGKVVGVAALNAIYRRGPEATQAVRARAAALATDGPADPAPTLQRWFGTAPKGALHAAAEACRQWLTDADPEGYAKAYRLFADQDGPDDMLLAGLMMPALFMTAQGDPNSTPAMSRSMARIAPKGQAVVVQGAAHMMPMTHASAVAQALRATFAGGLA
jgi:pimeloyl-ACP methyl ester carboxylesterase